MLLNGIKVLKNYAIKKKLFRFNTFMSVSRLYFVVRKFPQKSLHYGLSVRKFMSSSLIHSDLSTISILGIISIELCISLVVTDLLFFSFLSFSSQKAQFHNATLPLSLHISSLNEALFISNLLLKIS